MEAKLFDCIWRLADMRLHGFLRGDVAFRRDDVLAGIHYREDSCEAQEHDSAREKVEDENLVHGSLNAPLFPEQYLSQIVLVFRVFYVIDYAVRNSCGVFTI